MSDATKRYTEREFSLILSKAAELAGSSNSVDHVEDGLTLREITTIAVEAGLDPHAIARAARLISDEGRPSVLHRVVGGALRVRREFDLPGELTNERAQRILHAARKTMQTHGVRGDANASDVSWSTRHVFVSAHGEAGKTRVQLTVDHRAAALVVPLILGPLGVVATLYAAIAAGDSGFANPYVVLGVGAGATVAYVWSAVRRKAGKTRATLESLIDAVGESLDRDRAS